MKTIPLTGGGEALVDDADYESVMRHKWHTITSGNGKRYVSRMSVTDGKWHRILLHREIMGVERGARVDHKDGDALNNTRGNLRPATHKQNMANMRPRRVAASGYRGVHRSGRKWQTVVHGKHVGVFPSVEEAARAYDAEAREQFGEFARLNFPLPGEQSGRVDSAIARIGAD